MSVTVEDYSKSSVIVKGDATRDHSQRLREMGGSWNRTLRGWMFSNTRSHDVRDFVARINAGEVPPQPAISPTRIPPVQGRHMPVPYQRPQPTTPVYRTRQPTPEGTSINLNYPATFVGADNIPYQILIYTVPMPKVGQKVNIIYDDKNDSYVISEVEKKSLPYDSILIHPVNDPNSISRAKIINGEFQIPGFATKHTLAFVPEVNESTHENVTIPILSSSSQPAYVGVPQVIKLPSLPNTTE